MASQGLTPAQGALDLRVEVETEVQGLNIGVLSDGTAFLTQRGLARLCGVENRHIATIGQDWNDTVQKGRITTIKGFLSKLGITLDMPYTEIREAKRTIHAYSDVASLAILEYFAFEAGTLNQAQARDNFRSLAGRGLRDFIYTQVGYDPSAVVPPVWKHFHDRVLLVNNAVPHGYFSVFREMSDFVIALIHSGMVFDDRMLPDGSVGTYWSRYWVDSNLDRNYGPRKQYAHYFPDYFRQAASNPQSAYCYPDNALGEFRRWLREVYLKQYLSPYLIRKEKKGELPAPAVRLVLAAVEDDDLKRLSAPPTPSKR